MTNNFFLKKESFNIKCIKRTAFLYHKATIVQHIAPQMDFTKAETYNKVTWQHKPLPAED